MRPSLLDPLFASLTALPGIGPKLEKVFRRLFGDADRAARVLDLLLHLPSGAIDRRARPMLRDVVPDTVVTVAVTVDRHRAPPPHRSPAPYRIETYDDSGTLTLTYLNARRDYLEKLLPVGERRYVSGVATLYDGLLQMTHPDRVVSEADLDKLPLIEPVYPLTEGLGINQVRKAIDGSLQKLPVLPEWQDDAWLKRNDGSPMTNCSPVNWRSRWSARISAARAAAAVREKACCEPRSSPPCRIR
jgi:ATP-dependent DNA helicase RecG